MELDMYKFVDHLLFFSLHSNNRKTRYRTRTYNERLITPLTVIQDVNSLETKSTHTYSTNRESWLWFRLA